MGFQWSWEKERQTCRTHHTTRTCPTSPPSTRQLERQKCGRNQRVWASLPSQLPWVSWCSVPRSARSAGRASQLAPWWAGCWQPLEGLLCSLLQPELCCHWPATSQTPDEATSSPWGLSHWSWTRLACSSEGQPNFLSSYTLLFSSSGFGASNSHPNNITEISTYLLWFVYMIPTC